MSAPYRSKGQLLKAAKAEKGRRQYEETCAFWQLPMGESVPQQMRQAHDHTVEAMSFAMELLQGKRVVRLPEGIGPNDVVFIGVDLAGQPDKAVKVVLDD